MNIFIIIHLLIFFYNFYPLLIPASKFYDKIYLTFILIVLINWVVFKGECFISYLWKKLENPNYIMGSNIFDITDIKHSFPIFDSYFVENIMPYLILCSHILFIYTAFRSKLLSI